MEEKKRTNIIYSGILFHTYCIKVIVDKADILWSERIIIKYSDAHRASGIGYRTLLCQTEN